MMNDKELLALFKLLSGDFKFEEAQDYFQNKVPMTKSEFDKLQERYKTNAFTVSNYANINIIKNFHSEVNKAIEEGTTLYTFKNNMNSFLEDNGYKGLLNERAENIFRTNIQTAYNVGHYDQMMDSDVLKYKPYWKYNAVCDSHTRPTHQAMDGKVFRYDSHVWETWFPPNGYKCRCTVTALSKEQVERYGLTIDEDLPDYLVPDKGFHTNPARDVFKPNLDSYPEALKKAYENVKGGD